MKTHQRVAGATLLVAVFSSSPILRAQGDSGELWVTSQGTDRLCILDGQGSSIETVLMPGIGPHITTVSPLGDYGYVSGMRNDDLSILRADDRQLVQTLRLGSTLTHQAKPSPDGSIILADLSAAVASPIAALQLDPTLGAGSDDPDALTVLGNTFFVSLRASGQLAIVNLNQQTVRFLQLSPPAPFGPATCGPPPPEPPNGQGGCAIHGVTVRP
jgi:DNA-binding beta-propeller fold protein YncE